MLFFTRWDLAAAAVVGWALVYACTFRRLSLFRKVILPVFAISVTLLLALLLRSVTADGGMSAVIRNLAFRPPSDPLSMVATALQCVLCDSFLVSGAVVCLASFSRFNQKVKDLNTLESMKFSTDVFPEGAPRRPVRLRRSPARGLRCHHVPLRPRPSRSPQASHSVMP